MKSFILALSLLLGLGTSAWAAAPLSGQARLQGTWQAVAAMRNGKPAPDLVGHRLIFTKDRFRITDGDKLLYGGTYAADAATRPAQIEFHQDEGVSLRGDWRGIYRFAANRLEIVDNADGANKPRPSRFVTTPGSGDVLVRFVHP